MKNLILIFVLVLSSSCIVKDAIKLADTIKDYEKFDENKLKWTKFPIVITLPESKRDQTENIVHEVLTRWNNAMGFEALVYEYENFNESLEHTRIDKNRIFFANSSFKELAMAYRSYTKNELYYSRISFNTRHDFSELNNNESANYFESVLMHEIGHLLGENHVSETIDSESVMNPKQVSYVNKANLSQGDVNRIRLRYNQ